MVALKGEAWGRAEGAAPCPILDTHTPKSEHLEVNRECSKIESKFWRTKSSRRLFSRVMLGLLLPGRYYFLTFTSSPESPPIRKSYTSFRMCLKRHRPGCSWIHVFTEEGHGVLHMVIRLKPRQKNLNVVKLREYWEKRHKAKQIKIVRVRHARKLANYLSDQRKKRKLGSEMSWQDYITGWHWSKGWIPKGYTTEVFGKLWRELIDSPDDVKHKEIRISIKECAKDGIRSHIDKRALLDWWRSPDGRHLLSHIWRVGLLERQN